MGQASEYNQVLLAISPSIFPVDGTFMIKIAPFYFITCNEKQGRLSQKPQNLGLNKSGTGIFWVKAGRDQDFQVGTETWM